MTVRSHLRELRNRLFLVAGIFIAASAAAYSAYPAIFDILTAPLEGQKLSYLTVGGGLTFTFMVMIGCGVVVALPFLLVSLYSFVAPALPKKAQSRAPFIFVASILLMVAGALFGYFAAIPGAINFLTGFAGENLVSVLTTDSYLNFILAYTIGLGLLFQVPLVLLMINWITPLGPKKLLSFERYVIVASFIVAAIITPTPDPINQAMIALPVIVMYQIGFFAVLWVNWREKRRERRVSAAMPVVEKKVIQPAQAIQTPVAAPRQPVSMQPQSAQMRPVRQVVRSLDGISVATVRQTPRPATTIRPPVRQTVARQSQVGRPRPVFSIDGVSRMRPVNFN